MTTSLIEGVERCLNVFPSEGNVHSPAMTVDGKDRPRDDIQRIAYGKYAMVYIGTRNDMTSRTVPAIILRALNGVGGHYFMSLETGKRIHANKWTKMNIDINIINKVHQLADKEAQPWIHDEPFIVTYKDEPTKFRTVEVGIIDQDDNLEHSDNSIGSVESRPENEHQQNVQEIQERVHQTL